MDLSPTLSRFVLHWGEMGARWGVNRTVAQIHALLYLTGRPMHADEICETLAVARSNVSTSLRELQNWGLVRLVHLSERPPRPLRDLDPRLGADANDRSRAPAARDRADRRRPARTARRSGDRAGAAPVKKRMEETLDLLETLTAWSEEMLKLDTATLVKVLRLGARIKKLLGKPAVAGGAKVDTVSPRRHDRPRPGGVGPGERQMRVLVCGSQRLRRQRRRRALRWRGHVVVETTRRAGPAMPGRCVALDFRRRSRAAQWAARLSALDVDAIVNCVGILMADAQRQLRAHPQRRADRALSRRRAAGVARIVQVSALGVGAAADGRREPDYLRSKRLADDALLTLAVDAVVVRPSLVYGPGSASARLFATLASLPIVSLPGRGEQRVQPIHVFELAEAIALLVERSGSARGVYELGGAASVSYREMLAAYRSAQGLGEAIWLPLPMPLMRIGALLAERLPQRAFCCDTLAPPRARQRDRAQRQPVLLGRAPATLADGLAITPPEPALDLRVALAPPVDAALRASLAFLWLYTAIVSAVLPRQSGVLELLARCGFPGDAGWLALLFSCALNVALGVLTLLRPSARLYAVQALAVAGYTLTTAINVPALTIDHCGPLAKNVPVLMCVVVLWLAAASTPRPALRLRRESQRSPAMRQAAMGNARRS